MELEEREIGYPGRVKISLKLFDLNTALSISVVKSAVGAGSKLV